MKARRRLAAVFIMILVIQSVASASDMAVVQAVTTQQQIQQTQQEKDELEGKLNETQEELEDLTGEHYTLKGELNNLNTQLTKVSDTLANLENQIQEKEQDIVETQAALDEAKATEAWQYDNMVVHVKYMYERKDKDITATLLSMGSFADMLNAAYYFEKIAGYDQEKMAEFKENRKLIEEQEAMLQADRVVLENLRVAAEAEKNKVAGLISQTANTMAKYADDISEAERQAQEYEDEIKKKEEDLAYLQEKYREELALSQAAANASWRDISEVSFSEGDRTLLANLIYCEAGGEPYAGQLAVGSVVINRVLSSKYPNTVVGVIYQSKQFSPVASGRLELALANNRATAGCYQAADEAMSGVTNVGSCVYFRTPVEGLSGISIGGHIFY